MMLYDFVEIYDGGKPQACASIVNYFESVYDEGSSRNSGLAFFNRSRQKVCATKTLNFGEDVSVNGDVYELVQSALTQYTSKYDYLNMLNKSSYWRLCPMYNIQRYNEGEGFFSLHNEQSGSYPYRLLAWMVYLNDAVSGTEFPYQDMVVSPAAGRTVIWPAGWTHPHKGVTPNVGVKYIATGWFYTLPKGEPKFDGHHPDETNIQEIVV